MNVAFQPTASSEYDFIDDDDDDSNASLTRDSEHDAALDVDLTNDAASDAIASVVDELLAPGNSFGYLDSASSELYMYRNKVR